MKFVIDVDVSDMGSNTDTYFRLLAVLEEVKDQLYMNSHFIGKEGRLYSETQNTIDYSGNWRITEK